MSDDVNLLELPEDFDGVARLFPLPNLVMFPGVMQPLHIFESRYCEMLEDALMSDQLIGMGLLQPGWESDYESRPPVWETLCVGRIVSHSRDENGRFNILLLGLTRARMVRELPPQRAFREAEVQPVSDLYPQAATATRGLLQRELLEVFRRQASPLLAGEQIDQMLASEAPLGILTDIIAYTAGLTLDDKQLLLSEPNVDNRARKLIELVGSWDEPPRRPFPPDVSDN
ncbi:LON peptidase substrate-binding domain-containing protein [Lignipirellula cremea]|uniref:Lon protease 2 n=1 Tax=Lignipirellula cremea TaxID=2528010 RepID=A0A518E236_9BACT|nr:LON peptidase substrate-binding domain-containing protein [Lignipirellula cremea]QDU98133.1 Lon protease 2 [Lignipirellula cremea]